MKKQKILIVIASIINLSDWYIAYQIKDNSNSSQNYFIWLIFIRLLPALIIGFIGFKGGVRKSIQGFTISLFQIAIPISSFNKSSLQQSAILYSFPIVFLQLYYFSAQGLLLDQHLNLQGQGQMILNQIANAFIMLQSLEEENDEDYEKFRFNTNSILNLLSGFDYYGIGFISCLFFFQEGIGSRVLTVIILLFVVELITNRLVNKVLKKLKVAWFQNFNFKYLYSLVYLNERKINSKDAIRILITNAKILIFRSIKIAILFYFDLYTQESFLLKTASSFQTRNVNALIWVYISLNILQIAYYMRLSFSFYNEINLFQSTDKYQQLEKCINQIPNKQFTYIMNVDNLIDEAMTNRQSGLKEVTEQSLFKQILNICFKVDTKIWKTKSVFVEGFIQYSYVTDYVKANPTSKKELQLSLTYINQSLINVCFGKNEINSLLMQIIESFGMFSQPSQILISKVAQQYHINIFQGYFLQVFAFSRLISSHIDNHPGQILYDLYQV